MAAAAAGRAPLLSLSRVVGLLLAAAGALVGAGRLGDNSFFTHLATGRLILETGSVPSTDPYTFTAGGEPWVVQSWLVSVAYAASERALDLAGPRLLHLGLAAGVALAAWYLAEGSRSLIGRVLAAAAALVGGAAGWSERPLMVGLLCFCLVWLLALRGRKLWLLVPVMWVWVNSHGSFPLAFVLLGALILGRLLDRGSARNLVGALGWLLTGLAAGALVSPVGPAIVRFPLDLLGRAEVLQSVVEWRSPDFTDLGTRLFLVVLLAGMVSLRRATSWELALPFVAFAAMALVSARNIPLAALCTVPVVAAALPPLGELRGEEVVPAGRIFAALAGVLLLLAVALAGSAPHLDLAGYPVATVALLEAEGVLPDVEGRGVAHRERVGNYLELVHGATGSVFFDDRFDMYGEAVLADMLDLHRGRRVLEVLDAYEVEYVLWESDSVVAGVLEASAEWTPRADVPDDGWSLFRRGGVAP